MTAPSLHIQHLYSRAGFGLSPAEMQVKSQFDKQQALDDLFAEIQPKVKLAAAVSPPPAAKGMSRMMRSERRKEQKKIVISQSEQWLRRMGNDRENALLERMTLFWHGHFACETKIARFAALQTDCLREHALGKFGDLLLGVARDGAMIRYLNNQQNRKDQPNENFARELMELFTLGRGHYSETDVKEAARAFTGWSANQEGAFVFKEKNHDFGKKIFLGETGNFDGTDILRIILEKPQTALFLTRKIYAYFVNEKIDERRTADLAQEFFASGYDIKKLMYRIFSAAWFYDAENIGNKIKSPADFIAGLMRTLDLKTENPRAVTMLQRALGQQLYSPPNVAGWKGGKAWIDNSTLLLRLNLVNYIVNAEADRAKKMHNNPLRKIKVHLDFQPLIDLTADLTDAEVLPFLTNYLIHTPEKARLLPKIEKFTTGTSRAEYVKNACLRLMNTPEYQVC